MGKVKIANIESAIEIIYGTQNKIINMNVISEIFKKHYKKLELYSDESPAYQNKLYTDIYTCKKSILCLVSIIGYNFFCSEKKQEIMLVINKNIKTIYKTKETFVLDKNRLLFACNEYIKLYIVFEIRRSITFIIHTLKKSINVITKRCKIDLECLIKQGETHKINRTRDINRILCQRKYVCKLKIYNLTLIRIIGFIEVYNKSFINNLNINTEK